MQLLELTRGHHQEYAQRHGMDYWCVVGNPAVDKRPGWGKVPLLLSAIELGYDPVIWIDADAVIVRPDVDLSIQSLGGIGLVRHPSPEHWNTGVVLCRASAATEEFWRSVEQSPENNSAWMEQAAVNSLARDPRFGKLFEALDLEFNSVPGFAMATDPVIVGAHGMPLDERVSLLREIVKNVDQMSSRRAPELRSRDDFAEFLNSRTLVGEAVEVGVGRGEFSRAFLDRWQGRLLHLVDPWRHLPNYVDIANVADAGHEARLAEALKRLESHRGRFRVHRTCSLDAALFFDDVSLDFVYLDANHAFEAVWNDLNAWFPKLKSGGVFAGHDFLDGDLPEGQFGVKSAVRKFAAQIGLSVCQTAERTWPSWFFVKP
jgi:hypothetical protein